MVRLNSAIKHLNLEKQLGKIKSIEPIGNKGVGYTVTDAKGEKHKYLVEGAKNEEYKISSDAVRKITGEVKAGTLGDGPVAIKGMQVENEENNWNWFSRTVKVVSSIEVSV